MKTAVREIDVEITNKQSSTEEIELILSKRRIYIKGRRKHIDKKKQNKQLRDKILTFN